MTNERLRQSIEQLTKDTTAERIKRREAMDNLIAQDADLIDANDKDSAVLLPCPFCGGVQIEAFHHIDRGWGASWHVECLAEECGNSTCHHDTEATAIAAWNKRQPTQSDNNFHKLALSESFERVAKVAKEREAFNEEMALREALADLLHAVCGRTGFAETVRRDSGRIYPWPALDLAEAKARAALEQSK